MELKTFRASSPAAALKKAQAHCGEDAMVVSTKQLRKKTLTQDPVYEIVVVNAQEAQQQSQQGGGRQQSQSRSRYEDSSQQQDSARQKSGSIEDEFKNSQDILVNISEAAKQISKITHLDEEGQQQKSKDFSSEKRLNKPQQDQAPVQPEGHSSKELEQIKSEINKLGDTVNLLKNMVWDSKEDAQDLTIPSEFAEIFRIIKQNHMSKEHIDTIMKLTFEHMPLSMRHNSTTIKRYFHVLLRKMIPTRIEQPVIAPKKKIMMFVGSTGVGKTTTIAKLAARYAYMMDHKHKVGLITLDTYRIGAVEQLMHYAKTMRLSIEAVVDPPEFVTALDSLRNCDVILIDTVGSSQYDKEKIEKIQSFLSTQSDFAIDINLVLSATTKYEDLKDIYQNFSFLGIDTMVFTKLDETNVFGNIFSLVYEKQKPVSYFSIGQEVPDDITNADADYLVGCLLEGFSKDKK
ncbi:MAG: flagellar biosynthesis protein FlhF [Campylobacterota bacterium]